ncbi:Nif3-like dinuclear metal center hexameric protein [Virgibacillus byunsanensis]|uniref:GTP cyclohydrolase 1 type 2 homolog n=1 Tax=Virgibacillus byunsanensis TaxID=570945 RepID=A0ABW3LKE2_9BACI
MKRITLNSDVFQLLEEWAPRYLAYDWDNVGLQIGSFTNPVKKIMVTLDVLDSVVDEAIEKNVDLIIAHHPILFKSINQIDVNSPQGAIIQKLIKYDISVYASHTNLDAAHGGVNDMLCDELLMGKREVLLPTYTEQLYKIAVYVPSTHVDQLRSALSYSGAGHIGNYSHCTFQTEGQGTFMPLEGTDPYIGSKNDLTKVDEVKVETIVQENKLSKVVSSMVKAHPYEEVAYDIFPVENEGVTYGIGRSGKLQTDMSLKDLSEHVKKVLNVQHVRVTGDLDKNISKIAILGGSGEKYIDQAIKHGADVYITGDVTFHTAQDAWQKGLSIIDPGHHAEKVMIQAVKHYIEEQIQDNSVEIITSVSNTDPFQFV